MLTPWKESYDQPRQHIQKQQFLGTQLSLDEREIGEWKRQLKA